MSPSCCIYPRHNTIIGSNRRLRYISPCKPSKIIRYFCTYLRSYIFLTSILIEHHIPSILISGIIISNSRRDIAFFSCEIIFLMHIPQTSNDIAFPHPPYSISEYSCLFISEKIRSCYLKLIPTIIIRNIRRCIRPLYGHNLFCDR